MCTMRQLESLTQRRLSRPFITTENKTLMYQRDLAHQMACNTQYPEFDLFSEISNHKLN